MTEEEKLIMPEMIPALDKKSLKLVKQAVEQALVDYDEPPEVVWGTLYLKPDSADFTADVYFDYTLEDYVKALKDLK